MSDLKIDWNIFIYFFWITSFVIAMTEFLILMVWYRDARDKVKEEVIHTFGMVALENVIGVLFAGALILSIHWWVYQNKIFSLPINIFYWVGLILLVDFFLYVIHYFSHHWAWFWASHRTHHSAKLMFGLTAYRQNPFILSFSFLWVPYLAISWIGFYPLHFIAVTVGTGFYDLLCHFRYGWGHRYLEWLFTTPRIHHLHHSTASAHQNKNFGVVFSLWDRIFGTFEPHTPGQKLEFGLPDKTLNFWENVFGGYIDLFKKRSRRS